MRTTIQAPGLVAATLFVCLILAGCTAAPGAEGDGEIASITTPEPQSTSEGNALFEEYGEPIRLRLDMTDDEQLAAYAFYDECIEDHGGVEKAKQQADDATAAGTEDESAAALCAPLSPLPPWELDRSNPDALAFAQGVVDCLKGKGATRVEIAPDQGDGQVNIALGGEENDARSISIGMQYIPECQRTVSAATR